MDNTWIKLYRKLDNNDLIRDSHALQIFIFLLINVDRETGEYTTGRFILGKMLGIKSPTVQKTLIRLEKKYKIVSCESNNRFTTIRVLNWAKYQDNSKEVSQSGINKVSTKYQQDITNQEVKNIEDKNIYIFGGDRPENKQLSEKERQKGIKSVKELLKLREEKFITPAITTGIHTDWQERAFREAEELNITLEGSVKGRWLKMYKQASLGRKRANLDKILPYLKDYPKLLTNAEKISYAFWIYEHGVNSNPFAN